MSRYVDTAVLVAGLTDEPRVDEIVEWLGAQEPGSLYLSWWSETEFSAALSVKTRQRPDRAAIFAAAHDRLDRLLTRGFIILPVARRDFHVARDFARRVEIGLRAGDALHLAVADAHDLELVTLDKRMASGGTAVGVRTLLL